MRSSVLFLIVLIAPVILCSSDALSLIDQTPEGKELLDTLFLQSQLEGSNFSVPNVLNAIKASETLVEGARAGFAERRKNHKAQCKASNEALRNTWVDLNARAATVGAHLRSARHAAKIQARLLKNANAEAKSYGTFAGMIKENDDAWKKFMATSRKSHKNVSALVGQIHAKVLELEAAEHAQGSFIQMDKSYFSDLVQMKAEFDNQDMFIGTKTAISNLLEIMSSSKNISSPKTRLLINETIHEIRENNLELFNEVEAENSTQEALNEGLRNLFLSNKKRSEMMSDAVEQAAEHAGQVVKQFDDLSESANDFVTRSRQCLMSSVRLCSQWAAIHAHAHIRSSKLLNYIEQVREIVQERFPKIHPFFLQRREIKN